jgi:hypothetical protein
MKLNKGILKRDDPPPQVCCVVSIPRKIIKEYWDLFVHEGPRLNLFWQLCVTQNVTRACNVFTASLSMFGKLVSTNDGESCHIELDTAAVKGWEGESDLHICAFVPTGTFLYVPKEYLKVSVRMMQEGTTMTGHFEEFPRTVHEVNVSDKTVHLVEALPGHEPPHPIVVEPLGAESVFPSNGVTISFPKCNVKASTFTTRITFPSPLRDRKVDVSNVTPCTVTITCGTETHKCSFPFPVHGAKAKIRVARKSGWIDVVAPLSTPNKGGYHTTPFPLLKADGELCNWNSPSTSFVLRRNWIC